MSTRIGFYLFMGLLVGAIIGNWLPYSPILETAAGGAFAVLAGFLFDKRAPENQEDIQN